MSFHNTQPICPGYSRKKGRKGIRNKVLIIYTVECSRYVSEKIRDHFLSSGKVDCVGNEACAKNKAVLTQLCAMAEHPNVSAVLVIGMGCEETAPEFITSAAEKAGRLAESFSVQAAGGTKKSISLGIDLVNSLLARIDCEPDTEIFWRDLCIGVECGASDYTSLISANPLVGSFVEKLTSAGGSCVAAEITETIGLCKVLAQRAANPEAAHEITEVYDKMIKFCIRAGRYSISPGNFDGGLTTIEEKSLGAIAKIGSGPIHGVLKIGETAPEGLWLVDEFPDYGTSVEPYRGGDASSMMSLVTAGCQILILSTGRGHTAGVPICPVIKLTGNRDTYERMRDDIDFDASPMLEDGEDPEMTLNRFIGLVSAVTAGKKTFSEVYSVSCVTLPFNDQANPNRHC